MCKENLYELADEEKIRILNYNIDECNGIFLNKDKHNIIALNNKISSSNEEKEILAEELGHHFKSATYPVTCTNCIIIAKNEYKAKEWAYEYLIPYKDLQEAVGKGILTRDELADFFDVTSDFMQRCLEFYIGKYGQI
jgi:hypothetical protein